MTDRVVRVRMIRVSLECILGIGGLGLGGLGHCEVGFPLRHLGCLF